MIRRIRLERPRGTPSRASDECASPRDSYPIPVAIENDQPWKTDDEKIKYVPLQVKQGDLAVFLQGGAYEVIYQGEKYFIVPQSSILMIEREEF